MAERKWLEQLIAYDGECFRNSQECSRCDVYNKDEHCTRVAALETAKVMLAEMNNKTENQFNRDDLVLAKGKQWRVDYADGPYLGLSSTDGSHKELHKNACKKISLAGDTLKVWTEVEDVLARVTMP